MKIQLLKGTRPFNGYASCWEVRITVRKGENPDRALSFAYLAYRRMLAVTGVSYMSMGTYTPSKENGYTTFIYGARYNLADVHVALYYNNFDQTAKAIVRDIRKTNRDTTAMLAASTV